MLKSFNCFKDVSFRFKVRRVTGVLLLSVVWLGLIGFPGVVSAQVPPPPVVEPPVEVPVQVVDIPDANLRAAIAQELGKAPGDTITRADMETLGELRAGSRRITDLRGIEFAINLTELYLWDNEITDISLLASLTNLKVLGLEGNSLSDISPLSSLTNLIELYIGYNNILDISPLGSLTNLKTLSLESNSLTDISPLSSLTSLTLLYLGNNIITDTSPLSSLINLTRLNLERNSLTDISPLSSLINLRVLSLWDNAITDTSPLSSLINLTHLNIESNSLTDISPLGSLTNLRVLSLWNNDISDIFPLILLTNLTWLNLGYNNISDIVPLIALTNLTHLHIFNNNISDIETLEQIMARGTVVYFWDNPAFETPGPKIEDGWVWLIVPATGVSSGSRAMRSGRDFLAEASGGTLTEAHVALNGARAGTPVGDSVWAPARLDATDPDNLNTLLRDSGLTDIRYPVAYGVVSIESETPQQTRLYIGGGPLKVWLNGTLIYRDTDYRERDNYETALLVMLTPGENVLFIAAYRQGSWVSNWGAFLGFQDGTVYTVGAPGPDPLDVNGNGQVNVLDLVLVAAAYGARGTGIPADVNADGIVNIHDLIAVAAGIDASGAALPQAVKDALLTVAADIADIEATAEAPRGFGRHQHALSLRLTYENVAAALADARALGTADVRLQKWIPLLEEFLEVLAIPETTALLPNYPNPFNPETWIPYQLAKPADVTLTIYAVNGQVLRRLALGHQLAGTYHSKSRAAYWDGRNEVGERVASGIYFYTFTAGNFTATRKMLIRK